MRIDQKGPSISELCWTDPVFYNDPARTMSSEAINKPYLATTPGTEPKFEEIKRLYGNFRIINSCLNSCRFVE